MYVAHRSYQLMAMNRLVLLGWSWMWRRALSGMGLRLDVEKSSEWDGFEIEPVKLIRLFQLGEFFPQLDILKKHQLNENFRHF